MRNAKVRFSRIGGALLAVGILLLAALQLSQRNVGVNPPLSVADVGMRGHDVAVAPGVVPLGMVLGTVDASAASRSRLEAHVLVPYPATDERVKTELASLADDIHRAHPGACAVKLLGYTSVAERQVRGDSAPWIMVWSPDGRGWDGVDSNDYHKHVYHATE